MTKRHATTVAVDARTSQRITDLSEALQITKLDVVSRAVEAMAITHAVPSNEEVEANSNGGGRARAAVDQELVLVHVTRLRDRLDKTPSAADWDSDADVPCSSKAASLRFDGSWGSVLRSLGLTPASGRPSPYTNEGLLDMLRDWYRQRGEPPTQAAWHAAHPHGGPSEKIFANRWGSWNKALAAAGLPYREPHGLPGGKRKRNRQMVTGGRKDTGPTRWDPDAEVESIRARA